MELSGLSDLWINAGLNALVLAVPGARILRRAGFSFWWLLLFGLPIGGPSLILTLFAFARWPVEEGSPRDPHWGAQPDPDDAGQAYH